MLLSTRTSPSQVLNKISEDDIPVKDSRISNELYKKLVADFILQEYFVSYAYRLSESLGGNKVISFDPSSNVSTPSSSS